MLGKFLRIALVALTLAAPIQSVATITDTDARTVTALGDGATTNYTIGFTFTANTEVEVWKQTESTTPYTLTQLVYGSGAGKFTISGGDPGTTVVLGTALTSSERLVIKRVIPKTQALDYLETEAFPVADHEEAMDKLVMLVQELDEALKRALKFQIGSSQSNVLVPEPVAGKLLKWNSGATALENADPSTATTSTVLAVVSKTANYTVTSSDAAILMDATSGALTLSLPTAAGITGRTHEVKKIDSSANAVTIDPNGSEQIDGKTTLVLPAKNSWARIMSDGTGWKVIAKGGIERSEVVVHTGNGRGAVNTKIRRFTTTLKNTGSDITYADSADNGASFTINSDGIYFIQYEDKTTTTIAYFGPSLNTTVATTDVQSIPIAERLGLSRFELGSFNGGPSVATVPLRTGDIIRPHCSADANSTTNQVYFRIMKVAD